MQVPSSSFAAVLLLTLVPGWVFLQRRQRHTPSAPSQGIHEILQVLAAGLITTGLATVLLLLWPLPQLLHLGGLGLVDVSTWAQRGNHYVRAHPRLFAVTTLLVLVAASTLALLLDHFTPGRRRKENAPGVSVWAEALTQRPLGTVPYVTLERNDGLIIEGVLHSATLEQTDPRDIALNAPIKATAPGGPRQLVNAVRLIVPEREIRYLSIQHRPEKPLAK